MMLKRYTKQLCLLLTKGQPTTSFDTPDGTHKKFPLGKTSGSVLELAKRNFRMLSFTMPHPSGPVTNC